jgi:uncharacterized protein YndB with AHSA1/START domain
MEGGKEESMVTVEETVVVERPIEQVFAYVTDPARIPEWQSSALEAHLDGEGPMRAGSTVLEKRKFLGRRLESTMEVLEYEPPHRFRIKASSGPVPFDVTNTFSTAEGGTRISAVVEGEPGGFFRLAEPLVARAVARELRNNLETLKDVLEAPTD